MLPTPARKGAKVRTMGQNALSHGDRAILFVKCMGAVKVLLLKNRLFWIWKTWADIIADPVVHRITKDRCNVRMMSSHNKFKEPSAQKVPATKERITGGLRHDSPVSQKIMMKRLSMSSCILLNNIMQILSRCNSILKKLMTRSMG